MFYTNYEAVERFEKLHFQAHFSRIFGVFDKNQKMTQSLFRIRRPSRLSSKRVESAFNSWDHKL